jgi:hypothetical protein
LVPALIDPPKDAPSWPPLSPEGFAFETERSEYPAGFDSLTVTFTNTGYDFIGFQRSTIYIGRKIADGDDRDPGVWRYYAHSFGVREVYFPGLQVRLFRGASASFSLARAELVGEDDKREGPPYFPPGTYQLILCNQISSAGPESYFGGVRTPSFTLTAP